MTKYKSIEDIAFRLGWSDIETIHAKESVNNDYGDECVILAHSGREIRTPAYPDDADYIRITQHGFELAYWTSDEWKESSSEVIGAVMGALKNQVATPESEDLTCMFEFYPSKGTRFQENLL